MTIEMTDVKWGSDEDDAHQEGHKRRRATEIISAFAHCSECGVEWTATPSHDDQTAPGFFLDGPGVIEVTCPNGHSDTRSNTTLLPDPR